MLTLNSPELLRLRTRFLFALAWVTIGAAGLGLVPAILGALQGTLNNPFALLIFLVTILLNSLWVIMIGNPKRQAAGAYGLLLTLFMAYLFTPSPVLLITGMLTVVTAALIARRFLYLVIMAIIILRLTFNVFQVIDDNPGVLPLEMYDYIIPLTVFVLVGIVIRFFIDTAQSTIIQATRSTSRLHMAIELSRKITQITDAEEMMRLTVNYIRDNFGYYHAQVFILNDTGDQAVLRASTGDIGYQLLARRHQLTVGSQSVVGQAVLRGTSVLVADTDDEVVFFRNELLPNTRAELTIPLTDGGKVVGSLDIQSTVPNSFDVSDRNALEIIADALSIALRDARVGVLQTRASDDNTRLQNELAAVLRENDRLNRELTQTTWSDYLNQNTSLTGITLEGDDLIPKADWTPDLARATTDGDPVTSGSVVAVPVLLRGEVIGAIEVDPGQSTQAETVEIAQAVAQRLAVSLESARLYEETRQAAYQEQQINEIAARFGTTASIDDLLRITLVELGETLGAHSGAIRLGRMNNGASGS